MESSSRDADSITVTVSALVQDPVTGLPVVVLADRAGHTVVPIAIGMAEATAIAAELDGIEMERPMTHHLLATLLERMGARVIRIEVCDFADGTFRAAVHVDAGGTELVQDARPSDALALALRTGAPIAVSARVVDALTRLDLGADWEATLPPVDDPLQAAFADPPTKWKM